MLKSLVKNRLVDIVNLLPAAVQRAAIARAAQGSDAYAVFQALGRAHGIKEIRVNGRYGEIDGSIDDGSILPRYAREQSWDTATNQLFVDFFSETGGGTYLDIGANIGLTTIPVAFHAKVACLAFEPEPANYRYLAGNVARNCRHGNVETFNLALFDRKTEIDFELSSRNYGDHRIRTKEATGSYEEERRRVIRVVADRLDALIEPTRLRSPLGVKICTQGAEAQVLAGGQEVLGKASVLSVKYWPYGLRRAHGDVELLLRFLARHFSQGAMVEGDCNDPLRWRPIAEIAATLGALWRAQPAAYRYYDLFARK